MKTKIYIVSIAMVLVIIAGIGHKSRTESHRLPSILEVQRTLIAEGFNIEADGVLGPATQRAWEAYDTGLKQWWDESEVK